MPLSGWIGTSTASTAQTSGNRTRSGTIAELLNYVGGEDRLDAQIRAGRAWDACVREFNSVPWKFNRMIQDFTLSTDFDSEGIATVNTDFRSHRGARWLDANGVPTADPLVYIDWIDWRRFDQNGSVALYSPYYYTFRNVHETREIIVGPRWTTDPYPTLRLDYHRRIIFASGDDDRLNVPQEVEEAIFQQALYNVLAMFRRHDYARDAMAKARDLRLEVERDWRDYAEANLEC